MSELLAGRELDALVASKVFGYWDVEIFEGELVHGESNMNGWPMPTPHYSTSIADAWLVVEKLIEAGRCPHFQYQRARGEWRVEFALQLEDADVLGDSAPHAICLAALAAAVGQTGETTR